MLLITMNEWIGPGKNVTVEQAEKLPTIERVIAFATHLELEAALEKIVKNQEKFNYKNTLAVEYRLLSVSEIPNINFEILYQVGAPAVERL